MKHTLLVSSILATLLTASFVCSAQSSPPASDQSAAAAGQNTYKDPNDPSKGQELVGDKQPPATTPATVGQDKAAGNNLVPEKNNGSMVTTQSERPDFKTLDSTNKGYLTPNDVANHPWIAKNFTRCNTSHDGHLTSDQYAKCLK